MPDLILKVNIIFLIIGFYKWITISWYVGQEGKEDFLRNLSLIELLAILDRCKIANTESYQSRLNYHFNFLNSNKGDIFKNIEK